VHDVPTPVHDVHVCALLPCCSQDFDRGSLYGLEKFWAFHHYSGLPRDCGIEVNPKLKALLQVGTLTHTYTHRSLFQSSFTVGCAHVHAYINIHTYTRTHTHTMHARTHAYTHAHTHTHTHSHSLTHSLTQNEYKDLDCFRRENAKRAEVAKANGIPIPGTPIFFYSY
jgi:hypothetical protein